MEHQTEAYAPEPGFAPPTLTRGARLVRRRDRPSKTKDEALASFRAERPSTILLAVEHLAIARQMTTFLWILSAALMYQAAALADNGRGYSIAGLIVMAAALVLGYVSHRRLHSTITKWYVRDGLSEDEARERATHDVERAHSSPGLRGSDLRRSKLDARDLSAHLEGRDH